MVLLNANNYTHSAFFSGSFRGFSLSNTFPKYLTYFSHFSTVFPTLTFPIISFFVFFEIRIVVALSSLIFIFHFLNKSISVSRSSVKIYAILHYILPCAYKAVSFANCTSLHLLDFGVSDVYSRGPKTEPCTSSIDFVSLVLNSNVLFCRYDITLIVHPTVVKAQIFCISKH